MPIAPLVIVGGVLLAAAFGSGKKKKANGGASGGGASSGGGGVPPFVPGDDWPIPPIPIPPLGNGGAACEFDANMPSLVADSLRVLLANPAATPASLRAMAATMMMPPPLGPYPKAAACLEARAQELEAAGGGGATAPLPVPTTPSTPGGGWPATPPAYWPPGVPYPPPFPPPPGFDPGGGVAPLPPMPPIVPGPVEPGPGEPIPGEPLGLSVTELTIKPGDTAYGYARWYGHKRVADPTHPQHGNDYGTITNALLAFYAANNPHLNPLATKFFAGKPFYVPNDDVTRYGIPPAPTSQYQ